MEPNRWLQDLTSPDEETRAAAREELGQEMNDEVARQLLDLVTGDAGADARADAIVAFGPVIEGCSMDFDEEEDDPELPYDTEVSRETFDLITTRIRSLYDDESQPKIVRRRAFEVLIRDPRPWHIMEVRRHFGSSDAEWKRTAVFAMGLIPGFDEEMVSTLEKGDGELLFEAVRAAGLMELSRAASRIRELALSRDTELDLRLEAIFALPNVDSDCFGILEDLTRESDANVAEAAEEALEELEFRARLNEQAGDQEDDDED